MKAISESTLGGRHNTEQSLALEHHCLTFHFKVVVVVVVIFPTYLSMWSFAHSYTEGNMNKRIFCRLSRVHHTRTYNKEHWRNSILDDRCNSCISPAARLEAIQQLRSRIINHVYMHDFIITFLNFVITYKCWWRYSRDSIHGNAQGLNWNICRPCDVVALGSCDVR